MGSVTDLSLTLVSGPQRLPSVQENQLNIGAHQVPRHTVKVCHLTKLDYPNIYVVFKHLFFFPWTSYYELPKEKSKVFLKHNCPR